MRDGRVTDDILDVRDYVLSRGYSDERLLLEYGKRKERYEKAAFYGKDFDLRKIFITKEGYRLACIERGVIKE